MGGPGSGVSRKRKTLPRTLKEGGLSKLDLRGAAPQAVLQGAKAIVEDRGGEQARSFLAVRIAYRTMHLDQLLAADELRLIQGKPVDRAAYLAAAATWLRYATALGLDRKARRVPSLAEYLSSKTETSPPTPGAESTALSRVEPRVGRAASGDEPSETEP